MKFNLNITCDNNPAADPQAKFMISVQHDGEEQFFCGPSIYDAMNGVARFAKEKMRQGGEL